MADLLHETDLLGIAAAVDGFALNYVPTVDNLEELVCYEADLAELGRVVADARRQVLARIGALIPAEPRAPYVQVGAAEVRHKQHAPEYSKWDNEALLRAVLDSRLVRRVGPDEHGEVVEEVVEETPFDKVVHVYSLKARTGALRERGLDPADFCQVVRTSKVEIRR